MRFKWNEQHTFKLHPKSPKFILHYYKYHAKNDSHRLTQQDDFFFTDSQTHTQTDHKINHIRNVINECVPVSFVMF